MTMVDALLPAFYGEARDSEGNLFPIGLKKIRTSLETLQWSPLDIIPLWPHARVKCYTTAVSPRPASTTLHFLKLVDKTFHPSTSS